MMGNSMDGPIWYYLMNGKPVSATEIFDEAAVLGHTAVTAFTQDGWFQLLNSATAFLRTQGYTFGDEIVEAIKDEAKSEVHDG